MNNSYVPTYFKLKQAIDAGYNDKSKVDQEFLASALALLSELHPERIFNSELKEFNLNLTRHFLAKWKKHAKKRNYQHIIVLVKKLGAMVVKDESEMPAGYSVHDQEALVEMKLQVTPDKPGPIMWFALAIGFAFLGNVFLSSFITNRTLADNAAVVNVQKKRVSEPLNPTNNQDLGSNSFD